MSTTSSAVLSRFSSVVMVSLTQAEPVADHGNSAASKNTSRTSPGAAAVNTLRFQVEINRRSLRAINDVRDRLRERTFATGAVLGRRLATLAAGIWQCYCSSPPPTRP